MKHLLLLSCLLMLPLLSRAQVGIGTTTPAPSAALDITSTVGGILVPRLTQAQRVAIQSPATGLLVFQGDIDAGFYFFNGSEWVRFAVTPSSSSSNATINYTSSGF